MEENPPMRQKHKSNPEKGEEGEAAIIQPQLLPPKNGLRQPMIAKQFSAAQADGLVVEPVLPPAGLHGFAIEYFIIFHFFPPKTPIFRPPFT